MDTISLNPTAAPMQMAAPVQKSGGSSMYIVVFFLCVISTMAGAFYFMMGQKDAASAKKLEELKKKAEADMAAAKSEEEKREIARKAEIDAQKATLAAKEEMLKKAQARVDTELSDAAKRVREAKELQRKADDAAADAATKQKEAAEAMKKAEETNDANAKKLAEEKKKVADEAAAKVAEAEKKAKEAIDGAKAEAKKATDLQKRLNGAEAKLKGKVFEDAAKYGAVPGYVSGSTWKDVSTVRVGLKTRATNTPELCATAARKAGALAYGFRTNKHPSKKNTCFIYKKGQGIRFSGNGDDEAHITGCAFGGNPKSGCAGYPTVTMRSSIFGGAKRSESGIKDVSYVGGTWNDKISLVGVPKHTILYLYKDAGYKGGFTWVAGPKSQLLTGSWNNAVSSFKIRYT
jgi:hypothetical protein